MKEKKTEKEPVKTEKRLTVRTRSARGPVKTPRKFAEYVLYEGTVDRKFISNVVMFLQKQ